MIRQENEEISDDVYMTVVAICKGYRRRKKRLEEAKVGAADSAPSHIVRKDMELNQIIDISLMENCADDWLIPDMIDCIGDMTGYRKYKHNDRTAKRNYEECKRNSIMAIARRLSLM